MSYCKSASTPFLRRLGGFVLVLVLLVAGSSPAHAQFRDLGYTFEPTVVGVFGGDNAALRDEVLYGGALGLGFGRSFEVSGEVLINTGATTDLSEIDGLEGLLDRNLDVRRYGGRLRVNLSSRQLQPFLTVGTGALRLDPETVEPSTTIYALGGVGVTLRSRNQYRVSVGGEMLSYRYDPVATFLGPDAGFEGEQRLVRSPSLTASVSLFLGGRPPDEPTVVDQRLQQQFGRGGLFRNTRLFVNPFYGRIRFDDALNFPKDQNLAGVNAGVELGPFVGLRGFYWRATTGDDLFDEFADGFEGMEMYGGELRLRLNAEFGRGFVPYASLGGGFLNVRSDYEDDIPEGEILPSDRFFSMAGGGLEVPLTRSLKLSGELRSLIMSDQNADNMTNAGDLQASLMYNVGVEFRLGGGGRDPQPPVDEGPPMPTPMMEEPVTAEAPAEEVPQEAPLPPEQAQLMAQVDSLQRALQTLQAESAAQPQPVAQPQAAPTQPRPAVEPRSNVSGQTITIPVPENGEIYLRFGDGGGAPMTGRDTVFAQREAAQPAPTAAQPPQLSPDEVTRAVQEAVDAALRADTAEAVPEASIDQIVERAVARALAAQTEATTEQMGTEEQRAQQQTIRRMEQELADLRQQLRAQSNEVLQARREAAGRPPTQVVTQQAPAEESGPPFYRQTLGRPLTYIVPVVGARVGEGPNQFQLGVRGDYRLEPESRFHILPELAIGLGGGETSVSFLANGAYSFLRDRTTRWTNAPLEPYGGLGLGVLSDGGLAFEFVTNLFLGTTYRFSNGQTAFLEVGTLDFFDTNRFAVGYRIRL